MGKVKEILNRFKMLWSPSHDVWLVRTLFVGALLTLILWSYATVWLIRDRKAAHAPAPTVAHSEHDLPDDPMDDSEGGHHGGEHASEGAHGGGHGADHGGGGEHGGGGHGESAASIIAQNPIPKSIRKRQDGRMEEGHDLVDPEIKEDRGLASLMKGDVNANVGSRFVEIPEVISGTRTGKSFSGKVIASVFLEVGSYETMQEVIQRRVEFKGVVDSLISERSRDFLKTPEGMAALKQDIQREVNHLLKSGRVTDVLFSSVFVM